MGSFTLDSRAYGCVCDAFLNVDLVSVDGDDDCIVALEYGDQFFDFECVGNEGFFGVFGLGLRGLPFQHGDVEAIVSEALVDTGSYIAIGSKQDYRFDGHFGRLPWLRVWSGLRYSGC